jgi:hypothetical protein
MIASYDGYTAPGEISGFGSWLFWILTEVGSLACRTRPNAVDRTTAVGKRQGTWQRTAVEIAGAFLVLIGIAVGILALRFALVLMHGSLH